MKKYTIELDFNIENCEVGMDDYCLVARYISPLKEDTVNRAFIFYSRGSESMIQFLRRALSFLKDKDNHGAVIDMIKKDILIEYQFNSDEKELKLLQQELANTKWKFDIEISE